MATDKYPNQNVVMPMSEGAVEAVRARNVVPTSRYAQPPAPVNGNGSRRQTGANEWVDDRRIVLDQPASPSEDTPPEFREARDTPPASYDPLKVYQITLGKGVVFAGRMLAPGKVYQMTGEACTAVSAAVIDAVELGDIPVDPDAQPSAAKA